MALTVAQELTAVQEALQTLTTLDPATQKRRDVVSISVEGLSMTYSSAQIPQLEAREQTLLARLSRRNVRKRTTSDFS